MTIFALVDCNNFYVSCERAFNPALEGKPVIVLSNNDGCIISRSNEAKRLDIPMGAPFFQWEKLCKRNQVQVFSSNYELYGDMSRRVMALLSQNCPNQEIYSIDEAFLLLDGFFEKNLNQYAINLCKEIKTCTGIPISIGLGATKTLAKIANYIAKTQTSAGIFHLNTSNKQILDHIPVAKIWGIGCQSALHLNKLRFFTAGDLLAANPKKLRTQFNVTMEKIIYELRGVSCLSLESIQPIKQIIFSRSFAKPVVCVVPIEEAVSHYAAMASVKLRRQKCLASGISVFLQSKKDLSCENSGFFHFPNPTADTGYIMRIAKKCIQRLYKAGYNYHKAGLILVDLVPHSIRQFDWLAPDTTKSERLMKTIDAINTQHGKNTIFYGAEGIKRPWQIKNARRSPRYTTQWHELLRVN
jgi:DNA polymerase V